MKKVERQYQENALAAMRGTISDNLNPNYIFSTVPNELIVKVLSGEVDIRHIARKELSNRGYDAQGHYIGFNVK